MARASASIIRQRTPSIEVTSSVIDAAVRIIGSDGTDSLTVRRLAAEADVAPMTIYNRFGDMHGVFDAVFQHGFSLFTEQLRNHALEGDPIISLHQLGKTYRAFALKNPDLYRFMFLSEIVDLEPSPESALAAAQAFDVLFSLVQRALAAQRLRKGQPAVIAQQIWATCHGAVALELLGMAEFAGPDETYDALLITLLRGLLKNPEESAELA